MRTHLVILAISASGTARTEAAPVDHAPSIEVHPVTDVCVTMGDITSGAIREPTVRAFARGAAGEAAQLMFTFNGDADRTRALANGALRRQMGLKLRAQDSCNVLYVMWRLDPRPMLEVSVKANPGKRSHQECGADGYTKLKPASHRALPSLELGSTHALRAEIVGDTLSAWADGVLVWSGTLPEQAGAISGPAGMRSDNVKLDHLTLYAARSASEGPACKKHEHDD
jgi:hypothetical protein